MWQGSGKCHEKKSKFSGLCRPCVKREAERKYLQEIDFKKHVSSYLLCAHKLSCNFLFEATLCAEN